MLAITHTLANEHTVLCALFEEIGVVLRDVRSVAEVRIISRLVEAILSRHADIEQNLAYAALDHALAERGELHQLYQDHQEIDGRLHAAMGASELREALRLLHAALKASREHFRREEECVFPLFDKVLAPETLVALAARVSSHTPVAKYADAAGRDHPSKAR